MYRGAGAMTYYVPAYIGLAIASMGLISLPVHLVGYRERGVLRRFRASGMPVWSVLSAQVAVTVAVSVLGGALVVALANLTYEVQSPASVAGVLQLGRAAGRRRHPGPVGAARPAPVRWQ